MTQPCCDYRDHIYEFDPIARRLVFSCACECHDYDEAKAHDAMHPWYFAGCDDCDERANAKGVQR